MTNPYTAPIPPTPPPPPPGGRPLHKRVLVWLGGAALLIAGVAIGSTEDEGKRPVDAKAKPTTTITATTAATPGPAPTVTETVKAKPRPTVTVTKTTPAKAAGSGNGNSDSGNSDSDSGNNDSGDNDSGDSSNQDSTGTCSIVSSAGNCYSAGQFCRNSDHGATTSTASGRKIKCSHSSNAWRWTYL
ncbi:hypothetical protein [Streptomyces spirodelae]|uniref:DUF3761 domain-containing protein n=1 Tax=Streptomyces spirodelae TaxID=2812904 RepID=A0ABS3WXM4_9ACTN|nr:hypothetical protein [Streptomyces spirodelae]MBO8187894.1 hypothetical protein [Streptomyces spirodelae]